METGYTIATVMPEAVVVKVSTLCAEPVFVVVVAELALPPLPPSVSVTVVVT